MTCSLDKTEYEIDLSNDNAAELRETLARYVNAGRRLPGARRRAAAGKAAYSAYSGYDPAAVRAWAHGRGIEANARGRINADVVEQFRAAGNGTHRTFSSAMWVRRQEAHLHQRRSALHLPGGGPGSASPESHCRLLAGHRLVEGALAGTWR